MTNLLGLGVQMKKVAIVLNTWKLPIYKKILDEENFKYSEFKGPMPGCITLTIETETIEKLHLVVIKATSEAAKSKRR